MKKFRVGFLIDNLNPNQYVADLIDYVASNENFDDPVIITGYKFKSSKNFIQKLIVLFKKNPFQFFNNVFRSLLLKIIKIIETMLFFKKFPNYKTYREDTKLKSYEIINVAGTV